MHPPFPTSSLTGKMLEVNIGESLNPQVISAKPGDEVRWVNTIGVPVDIYFVQPLNDRISCQKGFVSSGWGYLFGTDSTEAEHIVVATVHSNDFANLCFAAPGTYRYIAKKEASGTEKPSRMNGTVIIE
jgi:plastocyanin